MSNFISIQPFSYEKSHEMSMSEFLARLSEFQDLNSNLSKKDDYFLNHQKIIARFMSPYTLFDKILILHDVGTGKSGVISCMYEEFYKFYGFDFNFIYLSNNEVTRNNFYSEFMKLSPTMRNIIEKIQENSNTIEKYGLRKRKKIRIVDFNIHISKYSKMHLKKLEKKTQHKKNKYTLIFVDEVHNLVQNNHIFSKEGMEKMNRLVEFIDLFPKRKTVYLTGTPMRHMESELIPLLSFVSDKKIPQDLFDQSDWKEKLQNILSSVHISYFRNRQNKNVKIIYKKGDSMFDDFNKNMFYNVYFQDMDSFQSDIYLERLFSKNSSHCCMDDRLLHRHAIIVEEELLMEKLAKVTNLKVKMAFLKSHSIIFYRILQKIHHHPNEKIFIYCKYIHAAGTNILQKILEAFGMKKGVDFMKLSTMNNCLTCNLSKKNCICDKDDDRSNPSVKQMVDQFNNSESIKIIIGTDNHSEGLSFFNIEQIHIVSPWWNLGKMKQVCGRGNRLNSHKKLMENKKRDLLEHHLLKRYASSKKEKKLEFHEFLQQFDPEGGSKCLDTKNYVKYILEKNNYDLERFGLSNDIEIVVKVYLHCAMPNLENYRSMKKKKAGDDSIHAPDTFHDILQYKKYVNSSNHEEKIKLVTYMIYKNSIDYHLNLHNNKIGKYDPYFKNLDSDEIPFIPDTISKRNQFDIFQFESNQYHTLVIASLAEMFSKLSFSIFVEDAIKEITKLTNLDIIEIAYCILNIISKHDVIIESDSVKHYLAFKNNYLYLYSNESFQDIFIYNTNEYLPVYQRTHQSQLQLSSNPSYNIESIKEKLNVKRKLVQISKDIKVDLDINNFNANSSYIIPSDVIENLDSSTIHVIESLPKRIRKSFHIERNSLYSKKNKNEKKIISDYLFRDENFRNLYFASEKNVIGIYLTSSEKFLIYLFNTFDFVLNEKECKIIKERLFKLCYSRSNNFSSLIIKKLRKEKKKTEITWTQKYEIILDIMKEYGKKNVPEDRIFELDWNDALSHIQSYMEQNMHLKTFGFKRIFNIMAHSYKSSRLKIDGSEIQIPYHFEYSMWLYIQMVQNSENNISNLQREKWNLFCRRYLSDKRMDSTGRNIDTLYFKHLHDIFQNYFSESDIQEIHQDISTFHNHLSNKENKMKIKVTKWREFLKKLLYAKNMVWKIDEKIESEN